MLDVERGQCPNEKEDGEVRLSMKRIRLKIKPELELGSGSG